MLVLPQHVCWNRGRHPSVVVHEVSRAWTHAILLNAQPIGGASTAVGRRLDTVRRAVPALVSAVSHIGGPRCSGIHVSYLVHLLLGVLLGVLLEVLLGVLLGVLMLLLLLRQL